MSAAPRPPLRPPETATDSATIDREARRILRRLSESGAVLAVTPDLDRAVVMREAPDGRSTRTAVLDRAVAQAFALKDWIERRAAAGRVVTYEITGAGRAALKRLLAEDLSARDGFAEAAQPFGEQHRDWGERQVSDDGEAPRRIRYNIAESPLAALARRREKDGHPFLSPDLVAAGERLREDFELAQMGPRVAQNWDRFLTAGSERGNFRESAGSTGGPEGARARVAAALTELGPGLGDMVLRVCCFLEGLETAEKRMGWSARSGKIVLRIALVRLRRHYDQTEGRYGAMIG
jgi:DNA-binding PadR family transcriptional regulator